MMPASRRASAHARNRLNRCGDRLALHFWGPFRRPAIRRRLRGRQIGIRAFGADTFGDSRRVPPPLRNVRAIGVSVAEGASARATTWKKACDGIASPTTSICTMRGACRRAGKPYRDTRSQSLCDPEPIYWPGLYLPSVKCPLMTQSGHCAAEEGARRHRCRSLGPSVAVHSRQIVIAIHYAKPSTIGKIEVIHGFARPARSRTFPEGF